MNPKTWLITLCTITVFSCAVYGQDQAGSDKFVSKEEHQRLKQEHDKLKQDFETLKSQMNQLLQKGAPADAGAVNAKVQDLEKKSAAKQAEMDQALEDMDKELQKVKGMAKENFPGTTKMLIGGYGTGGFNIQSQHGDNHAYATFNPLLLWKLNDRLLFEGEMEAELEGSETTFNLEMAQVSYLLNDYMTLGAGKFINPMNFFVERQHMGWVNKLPDKPLAVYDGFLSEDLVGAQLRGGIPIGTMKAGYAFFVANAPQLLTDPTSVAKTDLGTMDFNNYDNIGDHVGVGGRIGFMPIPALEIGYGVEWADVSPQGAGKTVNAFMQSVDASYVRDSDALKGILNLKAQWAWSHVDSFTYDPTGVLGGPFNFNNTRNGGYFQISYRPTKIENPILMNLEPVVRFDMINQNKTLTGFDEHRLHIGLDYWLSPSSLIKIAYVFDHQNGPEANRHDALELQMVAGF